MASESDTKPMWKVGYHPKMTSALKGKKKNHTIDMIGAMALRGPSTTWELAEFILSKLKGKQVVSDDLDARDQMYRRLFLGRWKTHSKKKSEWLPGLVYKQYAINVGEVKKKTNGKIYFLTLKGCLLALGYQFNDKEIQSFIKNAALNHPFFAYLNTILKKTSIDFVKTIFIEPIKELIKKNQIYLDDDISIYFGFIADRIEKILTLTTLKMVTPHKLTTIPQAKRDEYVKHVQILHKNTVFPITTRWITIMMNLYYPTKEEKTFCQSYSDPEMDVPFLYKIMRAITFSNSDIAHSQII